MLLKHSTASVFLLGRVAGLWQLGLVWHPRFLRWMLPGGHVEAHENSAQAAAREVREETGLDVAIWSAPNLMAAAGSTIAMVPSPLWIVEQHVPAEPRHARPHIHVDHLYAGVAASPDAATGGEHSFAWHGRHELASLDMFDGSRLLSCMVLDSLERLFRCGDGDLGGSSFR